MSIAEKIKNIFSKKKDYSLTDYQGLSKVFPQLFSSNADNYASFAYACANVRANNIGMANIIVQKYQGKHWIELENPYDYVYKFFQKNNIYDQSINDLCKLNSLSLDFKGVAYWWILRDAIGTPQQFIPLPSYLRTVFNDTNTEILYYELIQTGRTLRFEVQDILVFKLPIIDNPYGYKATISAIPDQLAIDKLQSTFQKTFLTNNARFDGFLYSENSLTDDQKKSIKTQWQSKYGGAENAGKTPVLEGGLRYEQLQSSVKEMDYVNSRNLIRDEILTIFQTPKAVLGITDDVNRASALATISSYIENNIIPFSMNISSKLTSFVKTNFRENLRVVFDFQLKQDPTVQIEQNKLLIESNAITINELRQQYNFDEIEGYDELKQPIPKEEIIPDEENNEENNNNEN